MKKVWVFILFAVVLVMVCACGTGSEKKEANLDGIWHDYAGKELVISNYTKESFDLTWDGKTTHFVRATSIPGKLQMEDFRVWYIVEGGGYSGPYAAVDTERDNRYTIRVCTVDQYGVVGITSANIELPSNK